MSDTKYPPLCLAADKLSDLSVRICKGDREAILDTKLTLSPVSKWKSNPHTSLMATPLSTPLGRGGDASVSTKLQRGWFGTAVPEAASDEFFLEDPGQGRPAPKSLFQTPAWLILLQGCSPFSPSLRFFRASNSIFSKAEGIP